MPPLIHIGYHKTATSWFQQRFYPLVQNGVFVPRHLVRSALIEPTAFDFSPERAHDQLHAFARENGRLLLCEENISGYIHNGGLGGMLSSEVARRLQATFPAARIIVFIRSQERLAAAAYAQYVHAGGTHGIKRYLGVKGNEGASKYWYKAPAFSFDHLAFKPLLERYAQLFKRSSVYVYCYEEFAEDGPKFIRRFSEEHGLDVDVAQLDFGRANVSLSSRELRILRLLNLLTDRSVPNKRSIANLEGWYRNRWRALGWLQRFLGGFVSDDPLIAGELEAAIRSRFEENNRTLGQEWDLPLPRFGYP
jgi:hypothetical protein